MCHSDVSRPFRSTSPKDKEAPLYTARGSEDRHYKSTSSANESLSDLSGKTMQLKPTTVQFQVHRKRTDSLPANLNVSCDVDVARQNSHTQLLLAIIGRSDRCALDTSP